MCKVEEGNKEDVLYAIVENYGVAKIINRDIEAIFDMIKNGDVIKEGKK